MIANPAPATGLSSPFSADTLQPLRSRLNASAQALHETLEAVMSAFDHHAQELEQLKRQMQAVEERMQTHAAPQPSEMAPASPFIQSLPASFPTMPVQVNESLPQELLSPFNLPIAAAPPAAESVALPEAQAQTLPPLPAIPMMPAEAPAQQPMVKILPPPVRSGAKTSTILPAPRQQRPASVIMPAPAAQQGVPTPSGPMMTQILWPSVDPAQQAEAMPAPRSMTVPLMAGAGHSIPLPIPAAPSAMPPQPPAAPSVPLSRPLASVPLSVDMPSPASAPFAPALVASQPLAQSAPFTPAAPLAAPAPAPAPTAAQQPISPFMVPTGALRPVTMALQPQPAHAMPQLPVLPQAQEPAAPVNTTGLEQATLEELNAALAYAFSQVSAPKAGNSSITQMIPPPLPTHAMRFGQAAEMAGLH